MAWSTKDLCFPKSPPYPMGFQKSAKPTHDIATRINAICPYMPQIGALLEDTFRDSPPLCTTQWPQKMKVLGGHLGTTFKNENFRP